MEKVPANLSDTMRNKNNMVNPLQLNFQNVYVPMLEKEGIKN